MTGRDVDRRDREALTENAGLADVFDLASRKQKLRPLAV